MKKLILLLNIVVIIFLITIFILCIESDSNLFNRALCTLAVDLVVLHYAICRFAIEAEKRQLIQNRKPNYKLVFAASNPPKIKETDKGIWRRVNLKPTERGKKNGTE